MLHVLHVHKKQSEYFVFHFDNMAFQKEFNYSHAHQSENPYDKQAITWNVKFFRKISNLGFVEH